MEGSPPKNMMAKNTDVIKTYLGLASHSALSKYNNMMGSHIQELNVVAKFITEIIYPLNINIIAASNDADSSKPHRLHKNKTKNPAKNI